MRSLVFPRNDSCHKISAENHVHTSINKERTIIVVYFFNGEGGLGLEVACKTAPLQLNSIFAQKDLPLGSPIYFIRYARNRNITGNWTACSVILLDQIRFLGNCLPTPKGKMLD